jgi:hypothetical protein
MISKVASAKHTNKINRQKEANPVHKDKIAINWRHYHSSASTRTLYDTGMTTAFPYAYGTIPVPFDCYVSSVTFTANKYSSYGTPTGTSSTVYIYKGLNTLVTSQTLTYTASEGMQLTHDLGTAAPINAGEKISIRWFTNGIWRYMNSTTILTER